MLYGLWHWILLTEAYNFVQFWKFKILQMGSSGGQLHENLTKSLLRDGLPHFKNLDRTRNNFSSR